MLPHRREMTRNATAETPMSDATPHTDAAKPTPTIDAAIVTANGLATHLGMTRQNVARLMAEAIIEQRSDGSGAAIADAGRRDQRRFWLSRSEMPWLRHARDRRP
jgi:hypothetical protein